MAFSYAVSPEMIAAANAQNSNLWDIPENANTKGDPKNGGEAYWNEIVDIVGSTMEADTDAEEAGCALATVDFSVPMDVTSINVNKRSLRMWYRLNNNATGPAHKSWRRQCLMLDRMNSIVEALGIPVDPDKPFDYGAYFSGDPAFIVGKRVQVLIKHSWYNGKPRQEVIEVSAIN